MQSEKKSLLHHEICMTNVLLRPVSHFCVYKLKINKTSTRTEALMHKIFRILKIHINFQIILYHITYVCVQECMTVEYAGFISYSMHASSV